MKPQGQNSEGQSDQSDLETSQEQARRQVNLTVTSSGIKIYHERQSRQLCALHALNNLMQQAKSFTRSDLDAICRELAPDSRIMNPHKAMFGLGCYDVNVIIAALAKKNYDVVWFDKRKELSSLQFDNIFGLILNVPDTMNNPLLAIPLSYIPSQVFTTRKHWIAIRKIGSYYYNLDSKLETPMFIGSRDDLLNFLQNKIPLEKAEILMVVDKNISTDQIWLSTDSASTSKQSQP